MAAVKQAVQAMVTDKRAITAEEAKAAMQDLFAGTSTQAQTGAFLTSLQVGCPRVALRAACSGAARCGLLSSHLSPPR